MYSRRNRIIMMFLIVGALALSACSAEPEGNAAPTESVPTAEPVQPTQPVSAGDQPTATESSTAGAAGTPAATTVADATAVVNTTAVADATAVPTTEGSTSTQTAVVPSTGDATEGTAESTADVPTDSVTALPDPANYAWAPVVSGLDRPLDLAFLPDGSGRMFVLEQPGVIRLVENGAIAPEPALDIRDRVGSEGNEQGLLGIAFHPKFGENGFFYVNYTDKRGDTVIARFQVAQDAPNQVDPNSEKVLLQVDQPYANHNGGGMVFGPDGYLYMGFGDGGSGGDPQGNGQSTDTLLGKLLRVDVDGGDPYVIPADNPFANGGGKAEIWAFGLRNPWRFSFDRLNGDLYVADVGQNAWEEVDYLPAGQAGANFGWNYREGAHEFHGTPPQDANLIDPVAEYAHAQGCSVTGGFVYRGEALVDFRGIYLYSDYCSGRVWGLLKGADGAWQSDVLFETGYNVSSFGQDHQGEIYIIDQGSGSIYRLQQK